ncbi:MAG: hypothetical protein ACJ77F_12690 [Chloroflexota bacterium]
MNSTVVTRLAVALAATAMCLSLVACSSSAAPSPASSASPSATTAQGGAGASREDPDTGVGSPSDPGGAGGTGGSSGSDATLLIPHPGTVNPRPVAVEQIAVNVEGHHVTAKLRWTSGVEPCYVLDSVVVSRDANDFEVTVVEGSGDPNQMCIEIAQTKATIVDLGDVEPGTYTISATDSQIPPTTFTVG